MILENISWKFDDTEYSSQDEFNIAIKKWIEGMAEEFEVYYWDPDEIVVDCPKVIIQYSEFLDNKYTLLPEESLSTEDTNKLKNVAEGETVLVDVNAILTADNRQNFSVLEIMFKLHYLMLNKYRAYWFEGLSTLDKTSDIPVCNLYCGT